MTYRVIVTPAAENDLRTAYRYIRRQAPRAARNWIRGAAAAKSESPHRQRPIMKALPELLSPGNAIRFFRHRL